jgi:hypothetical protein
MERPLNHIEQVLKRESMKNDPGSPSEQIPLSDQHRILHTDIREILAGRTEIFDDREPRPR